jgi:hypothetical protein
MQQQQKNFWRSCNKPTTVVQPMQLWQMIPHQDLIRFARFLSEKTMNKTEENLSWWIWLAAKELKILRVTIDKEGSKELKLTKGKNLLI